MQTSGSRCSGADTCTRREHESGSSDPPANSFHVSIISSASDTALRLAPYFKMTPEFWMNMQVRYELDVAEDKRAEQIEREVIPLEVALK
jgi:hypothetical protein